MVSCMKGSGKIHLGVGGWNFPPWRGVFYPDALPQAKELEYAASKLTATVFGIWPTEGFGKLFSNVKTVAVEV